MTEPSTGQRPRGASPGKGGEASRSQTVPAFDGPRPEALGTGGGLQGEEMSDDLLLGLVWEFGSSHWADWALLEDLQDALPQFAPAAVQAKLQGLVSRGLLEERGCGGHYVLPELEELRGP